MKQNNNIEVKKQMLTMQLRAGVINESAYAKRLLALEDAAADLEKAMSKDLAGAVGDLKTLASNPEFKDLANKGQQDGQADDEKVGFATKPIPNTKMFPTQAEIGFGNSLDDIVFDKYNVIDQSFAATVTLGPKGGTPVLCAEIGSNIAILDGHHRWSACFMANPGANMMCDIMKAPAGMDAGEALKAMQLGIAAKAGKVVTKPFAGKDLMSVSPSEVFAYVKENMVDSAIQKFKKYKPELWKSKKGVEGGNRNSSLNNIAEYIAKNQILIKKMKGPFPRTIMPQAGDSGTNQGAVNQAFSAGDINFKEPFKANESIKRLESMLYESIKKSSI